jgi:hypothetical protein
VPLDIPFLLFGNELKLCLRMYMNRIPISEQPFRLICSALAKCNSYRKFVALYYVFLRNLKIWDFPTFSFTLSGYEQTSFPQKGSDMKQRDLEHRKTNCHAFIKGVIDFSTKNWDEAIRRYINGF